MNTFLKILNQIALWLRKILGVVIPIALLWIIVFKFLPWIVGKFVAAAAVANWVLFIFLIFVLIIIILWVLDKGKLGIGGCAMRIHYMKPDVCVNVSCTATCISVKGPYPAWMRTWAPGTQDITCICSTAVPGVLAGLPPYLQDALNKAMAVKGEEEIRVLITEIMRKMELDPEKQNRLLELMQKLQNKEDLTPEEQQELRDLLSSD